MEVRRRLFQTLKPPCVQLSETAINVSTGKSSAVDLISNLETLHQTLDGLARHNARDFDLKLTDYVFYPLSLIFRERERVPFRILELNLECLKLLLLTGWRKMDDPQLAIQLLILMTFLAALQPLAKRKDVAPEEMRACALDCISELFHAVTGSSNVREALLQTQHIPALGHTITVIIENCKDGSSSSKTQLSALYALSSFIEAVPDRDVLQSFFPGTVSALSQLVTPSTKTRRTYKVYVRALDVLTSVVKLVLSDTSFVARPFDSRVTTGAIDTTEPSSWLKVTEAQLKVALSNVIRLRSHDRTEVRAALKKLCWVILVDCQSNLADCGQMMLETFITLSSSADGIDDIHSLNALILLRPGIAEKLRGSLYDWLLALPRLVQSNDDNARQSLIRQIRTAFSILKNLDIDMSIINDMLLRTVSDSLYNVIGSSGTSFDATATALQPSDMSLTMSGSAAGILQPAHFSQILVVQKKSIENMSDLKGLIDVLSQSRMSSVIARDALDNARISQDGSRVSSFYLALTVVRNRFLEDVGFNDLIDVDATSGDYETIYDELYNYARLILIESEDTPQDWRLQALALEALAIEAQRQKSAFRGELVDALYPVVHLIGSPSQALREHAITCLNIVASSCGYESAQDLVVSNVDYLVNAIGAKLNAFDISPQAPQVLLMMVRLCGPSLLPYLDDLVDNIFEALECFHGYQTLVELLFSTLRVIVEEGAKAPQFAISVANTVSHRKRVAGPTTIAAFAEAISKRRAKAIQPLEHDMKGREDDLPDETPQKPWAEFRDKSSDPDNAIISTDDETLENDQAPSTTKDEEPPLTAQYKLLTRITTLTQYHLPSSSPALRHDLLSLLHSSMPFLAVHEDTFLPLVHTLWPVLIPRLEDNEAFVVVGVLNVLGVIVEGAGDFVSARVEGLWERIKVLWKRLERDQGAKTESRSLADGKALRGASTAKVTPLSTMSQKDLIIPSLSTRNSTIGASPSASFGNEASTALAISSTRSLTDSGPSTVDTKLTSSVYTSTTTTALSKALTRFLVKLITHVRITQSMFEDVLYSMLWRDLLREVSAEDEADVGKKDSRHDVTQALEGMNADAVWLALFRDGVVKGDNVPRTVPKVVEGGVPWVVVS